MENQLPKEVIEMVQGAARMMIEDGVTPEMFNHDEDRFICTYIEAYAQRKARLFINDLVYITIREPAMGAIYSALLAAE